MEFALIIASFFVVAYVVGTLWGRTDAYQDHLHNERMKRFDRMVSDSDK